MSYYLRGKNKKIRFNQNNFVAKGGEGSIYRIGNTVYKIYEDPSLVIPEAKIQELSTIQESNVIKPLDIVLDSKNKMVGFTMKYVDGESLCKLFTNDFRNRNNISEDQILELVENIKETTAKIHNEDCLIVDGNELNYLVDDKDFVTPYFIDVNSWQTKSFPATAIMPSIRDWRAKKFTTHSDWFSFAIVTFQLFIGIHPFKGKIKGYKKNDFRQRVIDCVSVFNKKVGVPASARDIDLIPTHYKDWYYNLFEKGDRSAPPTKAGIRGPVASRRIVVVSSNTFEIKELNEFDSDIVYHSYENGIEVVKTRKKIYINNKEYYVSKDVEVLFTPQQQRSVFVKIENGEVKFHLPQDNINLHQTISCEEKMIVGNRLFLKSGGNIFETQFQDYGPNVFLSTLKTWQIMPYSSELFSGVIYQNILGKAFLTIIGDGSFYSIPIPELDEYKIIGAKREHDICVVIAHKENSYHRFVFSFDKSQYSYRVTNDIDFYQPNFTVLDNGIAIMITEDSHLEIFKKGGNVKEIVDSTIDSSMKLTKSGIGARFFKGNKLFSISMR